MKTAKSAFKMSAILFGIYFAIYLTSCIVDEFQEPVIESISIQRCSELHLASYPDLELTYQSLYGRWQTSKDSIPLMVWFEENKEFYVYKDRVILEHGTFQVNKYEGKLMFSTSSNSNNIDGLFNICNWKIYHENLNQIWIKVL